MRVQCHFAILFDLWLEDLEPSVARRILVGKILIALSHLLGGVRNLYATVLRQLGLLAFLLRDHLRRVEALELPCLLRVWMNSSAA